MQRFKNKFNPLILGFIASILILAISISFSFKTIENSYNYFSWVDHTYQVIQKLKDIEQELRQAESDASAYSNFKDEKYKTDFTKDTINLRQSIKDIYSLSQDNQLQIKNIVVFEVLVNKRIDTAISKFSPSFSQEKFRLKENMYRRLQLRKESNEASAKIETLEHKLLEQRQQLAYKNLSGSKVTILISGFISLVISLLIVFLLYKDIERRKRTEEELIRLNENKNKFFSIISHDLRGPVKGISSLTKMLINNKIEKVEDAQELFFLLYSSAEKTSDLLENLLTWARSQMNKIRFEPQIINLKDEINNGFIHVVNSAADKQIDIKRQTEEDCFVMADKDMIAMVIRNLLQNAIKFTHTRGEIIVDLKAENRNAIVSVKDNGVGISEENISKLFEINTGYTTIGTAAEEGTGLGLVLCKEFMLKNSGKIWVESELGRGSTFYFSLPLVKRVLPVKSDHLVAQTH